jgi:hypothetical protein
MTIVTNGINMTKKVTKDKALKTFKKKIIPHPSSPKYTSEEKIEEALMNNQGLMSFTAEELGISVQALHRRVNNSDVLKQAREDAKEKQIDVAEKSLHRLNSEMNLGAVTFMLKTKGKHRGYQESSPAQLDENLLKSHHLLLEQMAKLQAKDE